MKKSDFFIFTSLWEGIPNVIVETLSMSIPVISSECNFGPGLILCSELRILKKIDYPYYRKYGILTKKFKSKRSSNYLVISEKEKLLTDVMLKIIKYVNYE